MRVRHFVGIVLVDRHGHVLLQERDEHPAIDPEKWGFVGGHVDEGEEIEAAAYRELEEETGVVLAGDDLTFWGDCEVYHAAYDSHDRMWLYAAATDLGDPDIVCGEGRRIVFVEPAKALELDLTSSAAILLPRFLDSDLYRGLTGRGSGS